MSTLGWTEEEKRILNEIFIEKKLRIHKEKLEEAKKLVNIKHTEPRNESEVINIALSELINNPDYLDVDHTSRASVHIGCDCNFSGCC